MTEHIVGYVQCATCHNPRVILSRANIPGLYGCTWLSCSLLIVLTHFYALSKEYFLNLYFPHKIGICYCGIFVDTFKKFLMLSNFLQRIWCKESKCGLSVTLDLKIHIRFILLKFPEK